MKRIVTFAALFTSIGTLFCCAIPALFVLLGAGATFAALTETVPGILLVGEYKEAVFLVGGVCIALAWIGYTRVEVCDVNVMAKTRALTPSAGPVNTHGSSVLYAIAQVRLCDSVLYGLGLRRLCTMHSLTSKVLAVSESAEGNQHRLGVSVCRPRTSAAVAFMSACVPGDGV